MFSYAPVFPAAHKISKSHTCGVGLLGKNKNNGKYNSSQEEKDKSKN